jgi:uncharacterized membrane protein
MLGLANGERQSWPRAIEGKEAAANGGGEILSMLAALRAPVILTSQDRQATRDRLAAGLDYEVNLKAEIEIVELHVKLDQILSQHLTELVRTQREQLRLLTNLAPATADAQ